MASPGPSHKSVTSQVEVRPSFHHNYFSLSSSPSCIIYTTLYFILITVLYLPGCCHFNTFCRRCVKNYQISFRLSWLEQTMLLIFEERILFHNHIRPLLIYQTTKFLLFRWNLFSFRIILILKVLKAENVECFCDILCERKPD